MPKFIITNEDHNNLKDKIFDLAKKATHISIAVAFFSDEETISKWLKEGINVDLTISLSPPTNYYSLKRLLSKRNLNIRYLGNEFHSKIYSFYKSGKHYSSIIGSSNFTSRGLSNNIETNIEIVDINILKQLRDHQKSIESKSRFLEPNILDKYKDTYDKFVKSKPKEPDKHNRKKSKRMIRVGIEAKGYLPFWKAAYDVCSIVKEISQKEYPRIPTYLTVDHFWHWVVKEWDQKEIKKIQNGDSFREKIILTLFQSYCNWDKKGSKYTAKMYEKSKRASCLLSRNNIGRLSKKEALEVFFILHSTGRTIKQFNADESFRRNNRITKIRNAFNYLLYSDDDVTVRIDKLIKPNSEFKLKYLGPSGVQELLGWVNPKEYPLRNQKADKAIELLGYKKT